MAWLSVRVRGGSLVLRMEDIDPDRSKAEFTETVFEDLDWLGITVDEGPGALGGSHGPYTQSERLELYAAIVDSFERQGLVYPCYCTRKELRMLASAPHVGDEGIPYPGTCRGLDDRARRVFAEAGRRSCVRLNTEVAERMLFPEHAADCRGKDGCASEFFFSFTDLVRGEQRFSMLDCGGDFALRRSDGVFAYQLAVVADDAAMGVTEVLRGDDLLLSTPRQLLLFALLGKKPPRYGHLPLLHDASGERLAKRHKPLEIAALRRTGVAAEAVVGCIGWLAGLIDRPQRVRPENLLPGFSVERLRERHLQLPADCEALLLTL